MIDGLYEFQRVYQRKPTTWRDYVYGMRHLGRATSRESLRLFGVIAVAQAADKNERQEWVSLQRAASGW